MDIEKRALELLPDYGDPNRKHTRAKAVQLAREAADARAEEIAKAIEACGCSARPGSFSPEAHARIARETIAKPRTREDVLAEALREVTHNYPAGTKAHEIAEGVLEWKP